MKADSLKHFAARIAGQALAIALAILLFLAGWWFGLPRRDDDAPGSASDAELSATLWTCSMHPTIRQPNPGLCPICAMDLIPLAEAAEGGLRTVSIMPEAAALLDVRVSPVVRAPAEAEIHLFGRIAYDERRVVTTTARMGGRLDRLYVDFTGTLVREGDHLAEIYSPDLYVAQQELIQATQSLENAPEGARDIRRRLAQAAREKLRLLGLTDEQIDAISAKETPSDHVTLTAPQDGIVVRREAVEGQYVKTGDPLFAVADLTTVWLYLEAYESDLKWIRFAQDVAFTIDARPGRTFHGRVAFIDPQLDPLKRIVRVRVNVPNPDLALKPGMFARATLRSSVASDGRALDASLAGKWISPMHPEIVKDGPGQCDICGMDLVPAAEFGFVQSVPHTAEPLLVPDSAVLRTGDRAIVYVRVPDTESPTFEGREIVLGPRVGDLFIVDRGLEEGDLVVTRGAFSLDSELQINARPSMMNPNAGLEELPATAAPPPLAGQWEPVLRALGRLVQAGQAGQADPADEEAPARTADRVAELAATVAEVNTTLLDEDATRRWNEFSMRLLNTLTRAKERAATAPLAAVDMALRAVEETGRHVGLPHRPVIAETPPDPRWHLPLRATLDAYYLLSDALAHDDASAARNALPGLEAAGAELPASDATTRLTEGITAVQSAGDDIDAQRTAFKPLSDALASLVRSHGMDLVGDAYLVHCPMAFNDTGADWISPRPIVENPYFGDEMFACGAVTTTLSRATDPAKSGDPSEPHVEPESPVAAPHADHEH